MVNPIRIFGKIENCYIKTWNKKVKFSFEFICKLEYHWNLFDLKQIAIFGYKWNVTVVLWSNMQIEKKNKFHMCHLVVYIHDTFEIWNSTLIQVVKLNPIKPGT